MGKKSTYKVTGEFEIEMDGQGLNSPNIPIDVETFLRRFRHSRRYFNFGKVKANLQVTETKTKPQKDWGLRFSNRLRKAADIAVSRGWKQPPTTYDVSHLRIDLTEKAGGCGIMCAGGYHDRYWCMLCICGKDDCPGHNLHSVSVYTNWLARFKPDWKTGHAIVEISHQGNEYYKATNQTEIHHPVIIGHLDDKDIVDKMAQALIDIDNSFKIVKFHD